MKTHPLRVLIRLFLFLGIVFGSLLDSLLRIGSPNRPGAYVARAAWLRRWASRTVRALDIQCHLSGPLPSSGLLICNHLSYLDIVVLAAHLPMVFVAKSELRGWPVLGWCVRCAGTLFVNRQRRSDVKRVLDEFEPVLRSKVVLALFPEGTSSDGRQILPFHSSLLAPIENQNWPVTPAWLSYRLTDGTIEQDVAYWGDMTFGPHFLKLISKREIHAFVAFGDPLPPHLDRKEIARLAFAQVNALRAQHALDKPGCN
jgi:1-acyl-sn-glycerol-3-phosphate acyltransferase